MRSRTRPARSPRVVSILLLGLSAGLLACASAEVKDVRHFEGTDDLEHPDRVYVHDFEFAPEDVELNRSVFAEASRGEDQAVNDAMKMETGRKVADAIALTIIERLGHVEIEATRPPDPIPDGLRTLHVRGQFLDMTEGNRLSRTVIGFGMGKTQMGARVQLEYVENGTTRTLLEFETAAQGKKTPGIATPIGVGAATGMWVGTAVVGAASIALESLGPLKGNAQDTAEQIAEQVDKDYSQRGWKYPKVWE